MLHQETSYKSFVRLGALFVVNLHTRATTQPKHRHTNGVSALDDFQARSPDELSLARGDRIELVERDDDFGDGWYLGKHLQDGRTGLFPEGLHPRYFSFNRSCTDIRLAAQCIQGLHPNTSLRKTEHAHLVLLAPLPRQITLRRAYSRS